MELVYPLIYGVGTGFMMSVMLGAIFFMLIQTGVKHGYKKAFIIASGVIVCDLLFVILAISFTGYIKAFLKVHETNAALVGGIVLLIMGIATFFQSRENMTAKETISFGKNTVQFFVKPFLINFSHPANAAWWLGLYSVPPAINYTMNQKLVFGAAALVTVFMTEIAIAYTATKLKKYINPKVLKRIDIFVAVSLIIVSLRLLAKAGHLF